MAKKTKPDINDFIMPLNMNGLKGRMLRMPAPAKRQREILFIYGHHSSLERWWGIIQDINQYGAVTVPDLPGFGGMESFYKIGEEPTIDNLADYLAAFIKLRYNRKRVTIIGLSFGFAVVTRMLQRSPELVKKVDLLVSVVGFAHKDDFTFSPARYNFYRWLSAFYSFKLPSIFFRKVALNTFLLRTVYRHTHNAKSKFENVSKEDLKKLLDVEVWLWQNNDVRTYMKTTTEFLTFDNCQKQVNLPLWHISVKADRYFDNKIVMQHLQVIFPEVNEVKAQANTHAPSVIADAESAAPLFPKRIRQILNKKP